MLNLVLAIAHKEVLDGWRDVRSVISSILYALMGPIVVGMVAMAHLGGAGHGSGSAIIAGMMSIFTLVAAFVGGMNVAMDTVAGERERQSLLPLLLNPVPRLDVVLGKWLGVSIFAMGGFLVNVLGSAVVLGIAGNSNWERSLRVTLGILSLPLFAAAMQLLISTVCRNAKEAQTYLSLIVFLPMGVGMFLVFVPPAARSWYSTLPIVGQQMQLQSLMSGGEVNPLQSVMLGFLTLGMALLFVIAAANRLERDEIVYGN